MRKIIISLFLLAFFIPTTAYARIGVGVGTGKIVVNEQLKPGLIYNLPPLTVVNTGDEASDYQAAVTYHQDQKQLPPPESWFIFSPKEFRLEPGKVQVVTIKLNLPLQVQPGDYFAYLEAHPLKKSQSGTTTIAIAAAAKLYFTIVPANIFQAIYYKIISFWTVYAPWPTYAALALGIIVVLGFINKFFNIQIGLKKKDTKNEQHIQNE